MNQIITDHPVFKYEQFPFLASLQVFDYKPLDLLAFSSLKDGSGSLST
jgi:hypothetical protein